METDERNGDVEQNGGKQGGDEEQRVWYVYAYHALKPGLLSKKLYVWYLRRGLVRAHAIPKKGDLVRCHCVHGELPLIVESVEERPGLRYDDMKAEIKEKGSERVPYRPIVEFIHSADTDASEKRKRHGARYVAPDGWFCDLERYDGPEGERFGASVYDADGREVFHTGSANVQAASVPEAARMLDIARELKRCIAPEA